MRTANGVLREAPGYAEPGSEPHPETLAAIRDDARRERLLDMEQRLRRYRAACFGILAAALASVSNEVGWWWILPLAVAGTGFAVADRFMQRSSQPAIWIATAWAIAPLLLADAVVITGGAESPVLMWFALPAITLAVLFDLRGIVAGVTYIICLLLVSTFGLDSATAWDNRQDVIATLALVLSAVVLAGALVESERTHRRRSTLDALTGLLNRKALEQRLAELDAQPNSYAEGLSHALLLCDLDHFKRVNDQLGHAAGDAVLQDVAYTMRETLRAGDSIYRVGGEEILVILPGAGREDAVEIGERLRCAVRDRRPVGVPVTVSIGVAVCDSDTVSTDTLIEKADKALYEAKASGRDMVVVSD